MIFTPLECYRPSGDSEIASLRQVKIRHYFLVTYQLLKAVKACHDLRLVEIRFHNFKYRLSVISILVAVKYYSCVMILNRLYLECSVLLSYFNLWVTAALSCFTCCAVGAVISLSRGCY